LVVTIGGLGIHVGPQAHRIEAVALEQVEDVFLHAVGVEVVRAVGFVRLHPGDVGAHVVGGGERRRGDRVGGAGVDHAAAGRATDARCAAAGARGAGAAGAAAAGAAGAAAASAPGAGGARGAARTRRARRAASGA